MANMKIQEVEGIGPAYGEKFAAAGVKDTDTLLERGKSPKGRDELAEATGLSTKQVLSFVNMADLFRIKGVGAEYAELLEAAGVDTVPELKMRNAENLAEKMVEVNEAKKLTRVVPSAKVVTGWIDQAKDLPKVVSH